MEKTRYVGYIVTIAFTFLVLTAIKMAIPHPEPKKPIDVIGMELYKPIFYGTGNETLDKREPIVTEEFQDDELPAIEETNKPAKKPANKPAPIKKPTPSKTSSFSTADDQAFFDEFIADYEQNVQTKRRYRNDVVVRYYRHRSDSTRADVLVGYGFYLHVRPTATPEQYETYDTNIIYYGKDFPERDIKLIAYLLVTNGIGIKELRPFKLADGWKHNSIEIGTNVKLTNKPALTLSQIRSFKKTQ